jgi:hypothetical protein
MSINMRRAAITGAFVALLGFAGAGYAYAQSSTTTPSTTTPDDNGASDNSGGRHDGNCPHMNDSGESGGATASGASTGV